MLAHCGAQTTADTVALSAYAAELGVEAVAVIAPPYYQFDEDALLAHFAAAARACAPLPFYVYELENASGYAIPVAVVERLRELVDNVAGMKVSDAPFSKVEPYLLDGLDVFIGAEALIGEGSCGRRGRRRLRPRLGVPRGRRRGGPQRRLDRRRRAAGDVEGFPRHAALKAVAIARGVPMHEDVRRAAARADRRRTGRAARGRRSRRARRSSGVRVRALRRAARRPRPPARAPAPAAGQAAHRPCATRRASRATRRLAERAPTATANQRAHAECSGDESEHPLHRPVTRAMLHSRRFSPRPSRRPRNGAKEAGPIQSMRRRNSGRVNDYEIMLLLDPELTEERANEIIQRIRTSVEGANGTWDGHEPWGRRRLEYEIDHKGEAVYHLLLFTAPRRDARGDHPRPQDHRRRAAPRRLPAGQGREPEGSGAVAGTRAVRGGARARRRAVEPEPSSRKRWPWTGHVRVRPMTPRRPRSSLGLRPVGEERTWQPTSIVSCSWAT